MSVVNEGVPVDSRASDTGFSGGRHPGGRLPGDRTSDGRRPSDRRAGRLTNRQVRTRALLLTSLALAFYFGFIALTLYRSHH